MNVYSLSIILLLFVTTACYAQEEMTPKKYEDVEWYQQVYWKLDVSRMDSASKVLKNHLVPATKAAGYEVEIFQFSTGDWHFMGQFKIDSPAALEWEVSPFTVDLMKELKEQEGGVKALPYWGASLIDFKSELVMKRKW